MYEWLKDYMRMEEQIEYLDLELNRYKRELDRWMYGDLNEVKLKENSKAAKLEEIIAVKEHELAHKMNDLYDAKRLISRFKGLENKILFKKYVNDMTLESIAEELNYSASYIYKKHAELMRLIKFADRLNFHSTYRKS
ncbi:hypothetical protein [Sediminibacillus sp. JSM 1682029]|uniref:hypothetical protein n=1 Tax=Sediminibacillus sp. JSM 1682029 TaxID=3229857 RepID=UPI0035254D77